MSITLEAVSRKDKGKGSSRRLRRTFNIPGIIYGANKDPVAITLDFHQLDHLLEFNEEVYTSILTVKIAKTKETVIIKALQRHPATRVITHIDFLRIDTKHKITTSVPLDFINVKENSALRLGAVLNQFINSIEVTCLAKELPHKIEVDVSELIMDTGIKLTDLILPKGVIIKALTHEDVSAHDQTVVLVSASRKIPTEEEELEEESSSNDDEEETTTE